MWVQYDLTGIQLQLVKFFYMRKIWLKFLKNYEIKKKKNLQKDLQYFYCFFQLVLIRPSPALV